MNLTAELLRLIGSPCLPSSVSNHSHILSAMHDEQMLRYSQKNRILLPYLDAVKEMEVFSGFKKLYDEQISEYSQTFEAVARISGVLEKANIVHAVFKTLRPYIATTVDIDVILFGNSCDYEVANMRAKRAGYRKVVRGPMSTTFLDPKMKIGVDLYYEIAVSYVPYIDKDRLMNQIVQRKLPRNMHVQVLTCEADLIALIAHSIIKENMYTLSEFYTYIHYLEQLDVDRMVKLAQETHLKSAVRTHTSITALLYKSAYNTLPTKLKRLVTRMGTDNFEISRVINNDFRMPHKYHPATIARSFAEILREKKTLKGIANQIVHSLNARFMQDFTKKLTEHATRETY